jgi:hypothetical protein
MTELADADPLPPDWDIMGHFDLCEVCATEKTAGEPCLYCVPVPRATVSEAAVTQGTVSRATVGGGAAGGLLRGIDVLRILERKYAGAAGD